MVPSSFGEHRPPPPAPVPVPPVPPAAPLPLLPPLDTVVEPPEPPLPEVVVVVVSSGAQVPSALQMPEAQSAPTLQWTVLESAHAAASAPSRGTPSKRAFGNRRIDFMGFMASSPELVSCCSAPRNVGLPSDGRGGRQDRFCCSAT